MDSNDVEAEVRALEQKWLGLKLLIALSVVIFALPVGVWIVQSFQNDAGLGVSGGTLIENSGAVIHHNGALADTLTLVLTVAVMGGLVVLYHNVFDRLGER